MCHWRNRSGLENSTPAFYNILAGEEVIGQYDEQNRRFYVKDHPPAKPFVSRNVGVFMDSAVN